MELVMKTNLLTIALAALILAGPTFAEDRFEDNKIKNLITGIKSENTGLKKSSIYNAGYYKITEAEDALIEELKNDNPEDVKVLIALSLYKIGTEKCMNVIKDYAVDGKDTKVNRVCAAICTELLNQNPVTVGTK